MTAPSDANRDGQAGDGLSGRRLRREAFSPAALGLLALGCGAALVFASQFHFLLEDAFISLRYARNLHDGFGPLYNPGEPPVEGYTNFLWMVLCSLHFFFTPQPENLFIYYNRAFGLLVIAAVWWELLRRGGLGRRWLWLGVGLVALHQTLHSWMTGGLETHFFTLLVIVAVGRFLREEFTPLRAQRPWSALAMGLALLTRPEAYLAGLVCGAVMIVRRAALARRAPGGWGRVLAWGGVCALIGGTHLLWRRWYYGDWLPNTFYAKVAGQYFAKGIPYLKLYLQCNYLHWGVMAGLGAAGVLLALMRPRHSLSGQIVTLTLIVGLWMGYIIYIGGDVFEFRLLTPTIPLVALLVPMVFESLVREARLRLGPTLGWVTVTAPAVLFGAALLARLLATAVHHDTYAGKLYGGLGIPAADYIQGWNFGESLRVVGRWLNVYARPDERLATGAAGVMPYFSKLPTLDKLGLNDRTVSRMPLAARGQVGHERMATDEYLAKSKVVYDVDNLAYVERIAQIPSTILQDPRVLTVQLLDGKWMHFRTFVDPARLRADLRRRGAIVLPGPAVDPAGVWRENIANWPVFAKKAAEMGYRPARKIPPQFDRAGGARPPGAARPLGSFEHGAWDGWDVRGTAFQGRPKTGAVGLQSPLSGAWQGGLINTFDAALGDRATGYALSPVFEARAGEELRFSIGGGAREQVGVALLDAERVVEAWHGQDSETLRAITVDLTPYAGRKLRIKVYDNAADGNWGHILADQFVLRP